MPFFDPLEEEERSFLSVLRHSVLEGPLHLMRFTDSSRRDHTAAYGRQDLRTGLYRSYWMYAAEVEEILQSVSTRGPFGLRFIREISDRWAICDDWGDLGRAWVLTIPPGGKLDVYFGFARFQPKISIAKQQQTNRTTTNSYAGGSLQLITRLSQQECNWISGPLRTLDLSAKKLATHAARR